LESDHFYEELKDFCTRRLSPRSAGTFIESIYDKVDWDCSRDSEHLLETFEKIAFTRLFRAKLVRYVELEKRVAERGRLASELDEDGCEESAGILFTGVIKIEEKVGHVNRFFCVRNTFDDRRSRVQNKQTSPKE
jgi:hypothetical protein